MTETQVNIAVGVFIAWAFFMFLLFGFSSIVYAFRRYCDMRSALSARRSEVRKAFFRSIATFVVSSVKRLKAMHKTSQLPDFSLWENPPEYRIAIAHRCLRVGRLKNSRLYVSDYPGNVSKGYVKRGSERIDLDFDVETGPAGDALLLQAASPP